MNLFISYILGAKIHGMTLTTFKKKREIIPQNVE